MDMQADLVSNSQVRNGLSVEGLSGAEHVDNFDHLKDVQSKEVSEVKLNTVLLDYLLMPMAYMLGKKGDDSFSLNMIGKMILKEEKRIRKFNLTSFLLNCFTNSFRAGLLFVVGFIILSLGISLFPLFFEPSLLSIGLPVSVGTLLIVFVWFAERGAYWSIPSRGFLIESIEKTKNEWFLKQNKLNSDAPIIKNEFLSIFNVDYEKVPYWQIKEYKFFLVSVKAIIDRDKIRGNNELDVESAERSFLEFFSLLEKHSKFKALFFRYDSDISNEFRLKRNNLIAYALKSYIMRYEKDISEGVESDLVKIIESFKQDYLKKEKSDEVILQKQIELEKQKNLGLSANDINSLNDFLLKRAGKM